MIKRWAVLSGLALALACAKNPVMPSDGSFPGLRGGWVDNFPSWSRDGRWVVYHRRIPSADGPAGLYLISAWGGRPRLLTPGDFFWPEYPRFSPDGRQVVIEDHGKLFIVDVATGTRTLIVYPQYGAIAPDWSPDGRTIVYARFSVDSDPPDSGGIRLYDVASGADRPLRREGQVVFGNTPIWSRDGQEIAFLREGPIDGICLIRPDGTGLRVLAESPLWTAYGNMQWYERRVPPIDGVLFQQMDGHNAGAYFADRYGSGVTRSRFLVNPHWESLSPDGTELVTSLVPPGDSMGVLFIRSLDDVTGATLRQLNHWAPPSPATRAVTGHPIAP